MVGAGGEVVKVEMKNRYVYLLGDKRTVKDMKSKLTYPVLPYPKSENKNYDASYKPAIQTQLF